MATLSAQGHFWSGGFVEAGRRWGAGRAASGAINALLVTEQSKCQDAASAGALLNLWRVDTMKITLSSSSILGVKADLIAIGVRGGQLKQTDAVQRLDKAMNGALIAHARDEDFSGRAGEVLKVPSRGRVQAGWIVLVGVGDSRSSGRQVAAVACRSAKRQRAVAVVAPASDADTVRAIAEGAHLGSYRYTEYFTGSRRPKGGAKACVIVVDEVTDELSEAADEGAVVGESTNLARDLVNAPPNEMNPPALADAAAAAAKDIGIKCDVWKKARIEKEGMNLFLAVNRGSAIEPRLIHLAYTPPRPKAKVAFVGKGLTFDSGGLCLKPPKSMLDMKCDMGGAATTMGIVLAAAQLELPVEVHGLIGSTENMTGANAYRPGDVFTSLEGKTVEIINTDAEGRLVLADVLFHASKLKCDVIVDHATLTGACMVALGKHRAGLYGNDDALTERYRDAAEQAGEKFWRMPLDEDMRESLNSDIADLKHTGDAFGGSITAALFLREFIGRSKWIHCDIAGPAFQDKVTGVHPKGGSGFGVSTGVRFLRDLAT